MKQTVYITYVGSGGVIGLRCDALTAANVRRQRVEYLGVKKRARVSLSIPS